MYNDVRAINELVQKESAFLDAILHEVKKVIVGQETMIERMLIGLLTGGHVLVEGVPGLAKTLSVKTLCDTLSAKFSRIQFTPDMLPADVIGTVIYNQQRGDFTAKRGPIFANLVLADEINRAPAKVQSALLEAMQERQVTIGDSTFPLEAPFMVMATQNPVEQEGTYPLPEAQIDRFMLHVRVGHPSREDERKIMERMAKAALAPKAKEKKDDPLSVNVVASTEQILKARESIGHVIVDEKINDYIVDVVVARSEEGRHEGPRGHGRPRGLAPCLHRAEPRVARACVHEAPRLRDAGGREGRRPGRPPPPHHPDLRGRGRRDHERAGRSENLRNGRGPLTGRRL
jgi:MoxR-like ATPase